MHGVAPHEAVILTKLEVSFGQVYYSSFHMTQSLSAHIVRVKYYRVVAESLVKKLRDKRDELDSLVTAITTSVSKSLYLAHWRQTTGEWLQYCTSVSDKGGWS